MKTTRLLFYVLFYCVSISDAQNLDTIIEDSKLLFQKTSSNLVFPIDNSFQSELFVKLPKIKNTNSLKIDLKNWEYRSSNKDLGLVFKANANYNFRDAIDEFSGNNIKGRIRAEVQWNILKEGFFYNKNKAKRIKNDIEVLKIESNRVIKELWRRQFRIDYNFVLNKETIKLFQDFSEFENEYFDLLNKLYYQKLIKRARLIKTSSQIAILKSQIVTLKKENFILEDSVSLPFKLLKTLPILKVNLDSISLAKESEKLFFKQNNVKLQYSSINDINLSFYANQNFTYSSAVKTFFPSVGIRFRAHLRSNHRKEIIETKIKILNAQNTDISVGKYNATLTSLKEYNEKLKDLQNQYKTWLILEERIRVLKVLKQEINNTESGILLLGLIEDQFKVLENTIQLKRQIYKVTIKLFELNKNIQFHHFFVPYVFKSEVNNQYVSLMNSNRYSLQFQLNFIKSKRIENICVLRKDKHIQLILKAKNIPFIISDSKKNNSVHEIILNELKRINNL